MSDPVGPGRELDALVAERVFGLVPCTATSHHDGTAPWPCYAQPNSPNQGGELQCYSTDIAAAWEVVAKLDLFSQRVAGGLDAGLVLRRTSTGEWAVTYRYGMDVARAATAPEAICRAALLCVGAACGGETEGA